MSSPVRRRSLWALGVVGATSPSAPPGLKLILARVYLIVVGSDRRAPSSPAQPPNGAASAAVIAVVRARSLVFGPARQEIGSGYLVHFGGLTLVWTGTACARAQFLSDLVSFAKEGIYQNIDKAGGDGPFLLFLYKKLLRDFEVCCWACGPAYRNACTVGGRGRAVCSTVYHIHVGVGIRISPDGGRGKRVRAAGVGDLGEPLIDFATAWSGGRVLFCRCRGEKKRFTPRRFWSLCDRRILSRLFCKYGMEAWNGKELNSVCLERKEI